MRVNTVCPPDCPGRTWDCHINCPTYKRQLEANQKQYKARLDAVKVADASFDGYHRRTKTK